MVPRPPDRVLLIFSSASVMATSLRLWLWDFVGELEAGKWVPLLLGVAVRPTPDGIKIEMPH